MANEEHLERLRQGVEVWKEWRDENPEITPDLSKVELRRTDLTRADLSNAVLIESDLRGAILIGVDLSHADLSHADLHNADLSNAILFNTDLSNAILTDADFSGLNLSEADLSKLNLTRADLRGTDLSRANLSKADLRDANFMKANLSNANLSNADLSGAVLIGANLTNANLNNTVLTDANLSHVNLNRAVLIGADLHNVILTNANLSDANVSRVDLTRANLTGTNLTRINLSETNLSGADLRGLNLTRANLTRANLSAALVLKSNFTGATLTGACIADWQIGSSTKLDEVSCQYVYRTIDQKNQFSSRLPVDPNSTFAPGEFTQRFKVLASALETIDLTFTEGIDWQAFFSSFQELRHQYHKSNLSIQAMERKAEGFTIRMEVNGKNDKAIIETRVKQLYAEKLQLAETQYRQQLHAKDKEIEIYKQQSTDLFELAKLAASRPITVETTAMASNSEGPKYDQRGAQFAGGFVETLQGNQIGGVINNYGQNAEDIIRLLTSLREQAQAFPTEHKEEALDLLNDLEGDLNKPEPDTNRMGRKLKRFAEIATTIGILTAGAVTFSGNLNEVLGNVIELTETLGIPVEKVQPNQISPKDTTY